ncbi:MAG: deoxyribose-phosphate aldolase [Oscillospiraceae bacterium]|jgi:deoxyribose-phosphate aldolase|nr:deoxyribose-phosphate aldolase [Oscillospiraceae bacterium]
MTEEMNLGGSCIREQDGVAAGTRNATDKAIISKIDHTLLAPTATPSQIIALCQEALSFGFASVCVPPRYVELCAKQLGGNIPVCTVIGFPLGYNATSVKLAEAARALTDGAEELDMVIHVGALLMGDVDSVREEIALMKKLAGSRIVKVIVETCLLDDEAKMAACRAVTDAGADFIKTSTGFSTGGATAADVALLRKYVGSGVRVKASGGIRTAEQAAVMVRAGADRLGMSSAVSAFGLASVRRD